MEELLGGKIILNVEQGVEVGEETADNVPTVFEELILSVQVHE